MDIYRLITYGEEVQFTLTTAQSSDRKTAIRELRQWAKEYNWVIRKSEDDEDATAQIQHLEFVRRLRL